MRSSSIQRLDFNENVIFKHEFYKGGVDDENHGNWDFGFRFDFNTGIVARQ